MWYESEHLPHNQTFSKQIALQKQSFRFPVKYFRLLRRRKIIRGSIIFTGRNEVVAKVIFLHLSVIHSVHRGGVLSLGVSSMGGSGPGGAGLGGVWSRGVCSGLVGGGVLTPPNFFDFFLLIFFF